MNDDIKFDFLKAQNLFRAINKCNGALSSLAEALDNDITVARTWWKGSSYKDYSEVFTCIGGGKFKISGSILGAYIIEGLKTTLYAMKVSSTDIQAYKAVVIILLVIIGSPVVKEKAGRLWGRMAKKEAAPSIVEGE